MAKIIFSLSFLLMGLVHFSYGQQKCGFDDFVNNNPVLKSDLISSFGTQSRMSLDDIRKSNFYVKNVRFRISVLQSA